ncbi:MAG TPA: AmmeMemoRadiSam system protein A [Acidimicrobiales bacterium]|nr:AmmeMemoRadiSam system protein A [Acidimicrobiales bacterium]
MAPSPSPDPPPGRLTLEEAGLLVDVADAAIVDGLLGRPPAPPAMPSLPPALRRPVGAFVTLTVDGGLNGCIGSVTGREALAAAVARHAWTAAFADPRLPVLRRHDHPRLGIGVSVLSPLTPVPTGSREDLLANLRPGVDGLVLAARRHQGVFLPAVWEKLPDPEVFLDHLLAKSGLRPGTWPGDVQASRFTVDTFTRAAGRPGAPARAA